MRLQLLDGVLSDQVLSDCIEEAENSASYQVLHGAGDGGYGFKYHWTVYESMHEGEKLDGNFLRLWEEIKPHVVQNFRVRRCYVNAHTYGVEDSIHEDETNIEQGLTVVVYLCRAWYPEWFGQTVFWEHLDQTTHNDIIQSVIPKANRVLIFDKKIPHCVAPLSRRFAGVRLTCMYKLEVIDDSA